MPAERTYDYAIIRVVPRVQRGEMMNVGVILSCADRDFLDARIELDEPRLRALDPTVDLEVARTHLGAILEVCRGGPTAGPIGELPPRDRFRCEKRKTRRTGPSDSSSPAASRAPASCAGPGASRVRRSASACPDPGG